MTVPDNPIRPPPRRLGLYAPFGLLLLLVIATSLAWMWTRARILVALAAASSPGAPPGPYLSYNKARLSGFPFRLDLDLTAARISEPSGWALASPRLKAEAYLFSPGHWVAVAPEGVVITRRVGGPLEVQARVLRASLSDLSAHPARLSVEGLDLRFSTPLGARPFFLTAAREFHLHTRAGPDDQGAIYLGVEGGTATPEGVVSRIAGDGPVAVTVDGLYSHAKALTGVDWPASLRAWSLAGGVFSVRRLDLTAGPASLRAQGGTLSAGPDGRLAGDLTVSLTDPEGILTLMAAQGPLPPETARRDAQILRAPSAGDPRAKSVAPLDFQSARVTLGPVAIGPAPRLF